MTSTAIPVSSPLTLPCGQTISNRLVKAAMAEHLAQKGQVDDKLVKLYKSWGVGAWGAVMTGNVMVTSKYLGDPHDPVIPSSWQTSPGSSTSSWKQIASNIKVNGSKAIMQLNHPGRQSLGGNRGFFEKLVSPSAVPLNFGNGIFTRALVGLLWGTPTEMSEEQIQVLIQQFVDAARFAKSVGFDGVEIHAAHGYLLSSFLSPEANVRNDKWGGTPKNRARIVVEVIREIRKAVGSGFCVCVKMNSADQQSVGLEDVLKQVDVIAKEEIDFLEISGGSYEDPKMVGKFVNASAEAPKPSEHTSQREAYFTSFAIEIRKRNPDLLLMLSGGFRTRSGMVSALESHACDIVGVARPAALVPDFPRRVLGIDSKIAVEDSEAGMQLPVLPEPWWLAWVPNKQLSRAISGGAQTVHYCAVMQKQVSV